MALAQRGDRALARPARALADQLLAHHRAASAARAVPGPGFRLRPWTAPPLSTPPRPRRPGGLKPPADLPGALADLRSSGWESVSVAEEMRRNTAKPIAAGASLVPGVLGFEDTVVPQLENAILAGHDIILLGERGQAKTRVIRSMVGLLDEWMPIVAGSEINDDPYNPVSRYALDRVEELGEATPIDVGAPLAALRREAGHARHLHRRPHRRGGPDQDRRGPLPERRAGAALRPHPARQPRHLRHQRAAGPLGADPGRAAQHPRRARRADPGPPHPAAARHHARRHGQPRGLHEPRPHHHAAQGPLRRADPHALPVRDHDRGQDHGGRGRPADGGRAGDGAHAS